MIDATMDRSTEALNRALNLATAYAGWRRFDPGPSANVDARYAAMPALTKRELRRDFPAGFAQRFDHRAGRFLAAAIVIRGDLRGDLHAGLVALDIHGEDGNARGIGFLDDRDDRFRVAWAEHNGADFLDDEILHLVALPGHVLVPADDHGVVTALFALGGNVIADDFEKRIVEREQRNADSAFARGTGRRRGRGRIGRRFGFIAPGEKDEQGGECAEQDLFHGGGG